MEYRQNSSGSDFENNSIRRRGAALHSRAVKIAVVAQGQPAHRSLPVQQAVEVVNDGIRAGGRDFENAAIAKGPACRSRAVKIAIRPWARIPECCGEASRLVLKS